MVACNSQNLPLAIKLSYEGTGSLSQAPGGFYIERIVSLEMEACDIRTRELMIMRRLVSVSAEVSGLGHLMRANTSGSIYWGSGLEMVTSMMQCRPTVWGRLTNISARTCC